MQIDVMFYFPFSSEMTGLPVEWLSTTPLQFATTQYWSTVSLIPDVHETAKLR